MCFDRNINGNRDVKFLGCDYLLVQRCVKLTLVKGLHAKSAFLPYQNSNGHTQEVYKVL